MTEQQREPGQGQEQEQVDFEAALAELETLVAKMESGSLSLEESLAAFERGVKLTRQCESALRSAELRVKALAEDGSEEQPIVPDGEGGIG